MIASAMAAHVIWIGQPSGTVSSTMQVMTRRPSAAKRVPKPSTRSTGKMNSHNPEKKAILFQNARLPERHRQGQTEHELSQGWLRDPADDPNRLVDYRRQTVNN